MDLRSVIIHTDRLVLKPISPAYREMIFRGFTEAVARYTYPQPSGDMADTDRFIADSTEEMVREENLQMVAITRDTGEFVGCMGVHHLSDRPELGIWLQESAWGKGYGYEAIVGLRDWAERYLEYKYLAYPVCKENTASRRLAEKLGGELEPKECIFENMRGEKHLGVAYRIYPTKP